MTAETSECTGLIEATTAGAAQRGGGEQRTGEQGNRGEQFHRRPRDMLCYYACDGVML
jgi:hypothetical protein